METRAIQIREFEPGDLHAVEECVAELQDSTRVFNPLVADGAIAPQYLQFLLQRCSETNGRIFVAEVKGAVVGMVCVFAKVRSDAADEQDYEYAFVSDLVIRAAYHGQGLGSALLKQAEEYVRVQGAARLRIGVMAQNEGARSLYRRSGFAELFVMLQKPL